MADNYPYQRKRGDLGKPFHFQDSQVVHCGSYDNKKSKETENQKYANRDPNYIQLDNIATLSEHSVNTERVKTGDKGMNHDEGGWPDNIDHTDIQVTTKYKRKIEKQEQFGFAPATKELCHTVEKCAKQNNQIDMYEEYFENEISDHVVENLSTKTIMLFKDHVVTTKRTVSELSWHPENSDRIAASYAIMRFQQMPDKMESQAYVWNTNNPNKYEQALESPSPVTNIAYNGKNPEIIGGGCYNGLAVIWDARKPNEPPMRTPVELSHSDPITHFHWLNNRYASEFVTTSTDGRTMWWDTRNLSNGPIESINMYETVQAQQENLGTVGGTCLEYNLDAGPTKFLVGTESGIILNANRKPKSKVEIIQRYGLDGGRHLGPVYSIHRSPVQHKYFLSVGDWSCKVWVEDLKQPIIKTKYHQAYLSDGCWSPTRNGVFFLARRDGWMDVWDYYYRQNEVAFSHKVSDASLSCIKVSSHPLAQGHHPNNGKFVAVGDQDGTITILELCDSLYQSQHKEKEIIPETFDREYRKEKNLEMIKKQQEIAKKVAPKDNKAQLEKWEQKKQELISEVETNFEKILEQAKAMQEENDDLQDLDSPKEQQQEQQDEDQQGEGQDQGEESQQQAQDQNSNPQQEAPQEPQQQDNNDDEQKQQEAEEDATQVKPQQEQQPEQPQEAPQEGQDQQQEGDNQE